MIRTNVVELTTIKAFAYRQKLKAGDNSILIYRPDIKQPGIASISKSTGEPVIARNTNLEKFPLEAFKEAIALTNGMPYKKQGSIKVTKDMFVEPVKEEEEEIIEINEAALEAVTAHYTDRNGRVSYDLINKELIKFAKSSSIVREMIAEGKSAKAIREYIVLNKFRNISGNDSLRDQEVFKIADMIDGLDNRGMFRELNEELRKLFAKNKRG
jgi:hypothetical protein